MIFFAFNCKNQLKIVNNVVFVKLKRNFSQVINALLTGRCFYTGSYKALGLNNALCSVGHYTSGLVFVSTRIETSASQ